MYIFCLCLESHNIDTRILYSQLELDEVRMELANFLGGHMLDRQALLILDVGTMSSFPSNFDKMDVMFLKFAKDRDNPTEGSLSVGDNSVSTSQPFATPTPRRRSQSRLLELELYVAANGQISITITHGAKKPISPHIFSIHCLKYTNVGKDYIEIIKGDLQMLSTFKEFRDDCHRHFKRYNDPEKTHANPPYILVEHNENWHYLCDHYLSGAFQSNHGPTKLLDRSSLTIIATGRSHFYNDSTSSLSKEGKTNAGTLVLVYRRGYFVTLWRRDMREDDPRYRMTYEAR
uniref:CACTA en-spm transposon protein n=1 Tax=Cucumis melo TaxID=3656 RepID=A0A9I9E4N7_CUCME